MIRWIKMDRNSLQFNSAVPLYFQLKELLKEQILLKAWLPDQMIPSEAELSTTYDVSVGTVKKSLAELVQEGILYRKQGKGTFVARPNIERSLMWSFVKTQDEFGNPKSLSSEVLKTETMSPNIAIKEALQISDSNKVTMIQRVKKLESKPLLLEKIFVSEKLFPNFDRIELSDGELYPLYEKHYNFPFIWADEYIEAHIAKEQEIKLLGLKKNEAVISIQRIVYSYSNRPIETRWITGKASQFKHHVFLR